MLFLSGINDPVESAIQKYKNHPSIQMIRETFDSNKTFSFDFVLLLCSLPYQLEAHYIDVVDYGVKL